MRAILFPSLKQVSVVYLPDLNLDPNEVVVDVRASGICHTDIGKSAFSVVPGHVAS